MLYVPWWRRREYWQHDHNTGNERDWEPEKVVRVGRLTRVREGRFENTCPCGMMFAAEADRHVIYPPLTVVGQI